MTRDLIREHKDLYTATTDPRLLEVPAAPFLGISGHGDPNGPFFEERTGLLYTVAYTVRATHKALGDVFKVSKLEGLWWLDGDDAPTDLSDRTRWRWRLLLRMPESVTPEQVEQAREDVRRKKKRDDVDLVTLEDFEEGRVAQLLHIGPYAEEQPSIDALHAFVAAQGLRLRDRHHEIYLGDPRRSAPETLRTILRHPVE